MNHDSDLSSSISDAYLAAADRWKGCDWPTKFGRRGLELRGMLSKQTRLLAEATSGEESQAWSEATRWLEQVERDASTAQVAATTAVELMEKRDFAAALGKIQEACRLESRYRQSVVWAPLLARIADEANQHGPSMRP